MRTNIIVCSSQMLKVNGNFKEEFTFMDVIDHKKERCGFPISDKLYQIWEEEILLAKELLSVCKRHNIKIIAWAGTLLGAVRHNGFIPWDDDMDFAMERSEFEKLLSYSNEFTDPFFLQYALNDRRYFCDYARLRNSNTTGIIKWNCDSEYNC